MVALMIETLLGFLTFTGSLMAMGKLQEVLPQRPITYRNQNAVNFTLFVIALALAVRLVMVPSDTHLFPIFIFLALLFGVLLIIPIGGADMPTVIAILNAYAGLSACAMGFALGNNLLVVAGALDGSSGLILSIIMCRAMNRSFTNVLFGAFGQLQHHAAQAEQKPVRSATPPRKPPRFWKPRRASSSSPAMALRWPRRSTRSASYSTPSPNAAWT